jgi:sporulation protein YlmC with PRC-barrel domain
MRARAVAVMRSSGLALPRGTKVWPRRFRADPNWCRNSKGYWLCLKTLALSASVLAFASGLAFAETTMTREPSTGRSVVTNPSSSLSTDHWLASDVYKASVYDPSEHKIGNVIDLMIDSNGNVTAAIIGVGGFLGVAKKDVVIPFKELKVSTRDGKDWLVLNRTKDN